MALTITPLLTIINNCDLANGWSSGGASADIVKEGVGSLGVKVSQTLGAVVKYDQGGVGGVNMTGQHFYVWMLTTSVPATKANGGFRIYAEDTSANWIEWYVAGSDTYGGGWERFCVYSGAAGDSVSGTYNPANHRYIGVRFNITSKQSGASNNCYWDILHYGSGLKLTSGVSDQITWESIYSDSTQQNSYGIITKTGGIYFVQGELQFGDTTSGNIDFKDVSQVVAFKANSYINTGLYTITVQGNSTGTTNFQLGNKSGSAGISGCILKSNGTSAAEKFLLTATDTDIDALKLYGSTFLDASTISLPPNASGREVLNCNFEACAEVLVDTCIVQSSNFINADGRGIRMSSTSHNITSSNFINCPQGVHIPNAGTYTFDALKFSGNTYDIENSSVGLVTVNATNGANPATYTNTGGGTTTISNAITLTVTVKDTAGSNIQNARVAIQRTTTNSMTGAVADDGGLQTNQTTASNNVTTNDMTLLPAVPAVNDAYYFGASEPFYKLRVNIGQNGAGTWTITWEYYNGAIWTAITDVNDGTNGFTAGTGNKDVTFSPPSDWATTTVQSIAAYWVRARTSAYTSVTTQPLGTQSWVFLQIMNELTNASGVAQETYNYSSDEAVTVLIRKSTSGTTRYFPADTSQTITSSGLNLAWTLIADTIASA